MKEQALQSILSRLAITVSNRRVARGGAVWLSAACPFAQWRHKSGSDRSAGFGAVVNETGWSHYYCPACKAKGSIANLVAQLAAYRQSDLTDLLPDIAEGEAGLVKLPSFEEATAGQQGEPPPEPINEAIWDGLFDDVGQHADAVRYLRARGISRKTVDRLGIQFDPEQHRLTFPVKGAAGELYGFTGRTVLPEERLSFIGRDGQKVVFPKVRDYADLPKRWLILGRETWKPGLPVLAVEGLFAFAHMFEIEADEFFNVGALLGSTMTVEKADVFAEFGHAVYLLLDPDVAGDDGTFGAWDESLQRRKTEDSSVGRLWGRVPVFIPEFPEWDEEERGPLDVDYLTREEVQAMRDHTTLWTPDRYQAWVLSGGPARKAKGGKARKTIR